MVPRDVNGSTRITPSQVTCAPEAVDAADYARGAPRANAIGRMVDASEVADLAAFLCSDRAWCVTGETIAADGGGGTSVYY